MPSRTWEDTDLCRRKTGVTVPDSGVRDEHGMEPLENLFSSPGKSDQDEEQDEEQDDAPSEEDDGNGEAPMDITTSMRPRR
jgi:centromere protein C